MVVVAPCEEDMAAILEETVVTMTEDGGPPHHPYSRGGSSVRGSWGAGRVEESEVDF